MLFDLLARGVASRRQHSTQSGAVDRVLAPRRMPGDVREILHKRGTYKSDFVPRLVQYDWIRTITQRNDALDADSHRPDAELAATKPPALAALNATWRELKAIRIDVSLKKPLGDHLQIVGCDKEIDPTPPRTLRRTDKGSSNRTNKDT